MNISTIRDTKWARAAFLARGVVNTLTQQEATVFTTADLKFTNTELGGNFCINPLPQHAPSADIRRRGRSIYGEGMGRYYSETFDDHAQLIHMRFGVTQFNSLAWYIQGFYNSGIGTLARTGRGPGVLYRVGQATGMIVSLMSWPLVGLRVAGALFKLFTKKSFTKFVTLKPAMPLYWNAVQTMVNQWAVNTGIVPRFIGDPPSGHPKIGYEFTEADAQRIRELAPGIVTSKGNIDVFAVANRAQRQARSQMKAIQGAFESGSGADAINSAVAVYGQRSKDPQANANHQQYMDRWFNSDSSKWDGDPNKNVVEDINEIKSKNVGMAEFFTAELDDGSAFATFRVNHTGAASESFSNSIGESEIAGKLNSVSSTARNTLFTFAGGNIVPGVSEAINGALSTVTGFLDGVGLGGALNVLSGGANADIPMMWKSSTANLTKVNYTVNLVSPVNHKYAQLMFIWIPTFMLLAGVLPLSTGRQSYTAPLHLEYYDKGRAQTRYGIIDSMTITRGGLTNLSFNYEQRAMSVEISFSIADMSNVMHMPISMGIGFSGLLSGDFMSGYWDDDTVFSDYMSVCASMGLADQIYEFRRMKLAMTRAMVNWESWTSPARMSNWLGDTAPARFLSNFYTGVAR